jgi:hypothetical protein
MRIMWDWSAGRWQGITDSESRAMNHAEAHLAVGQTARVEKVRSWCGISAPLGIGWTATLKEHGPVTWVPFGWN